jgi:PAS domain-containing protein
MLSAALWSFACIFEAAAVEIPAKIFWSKVSYLGITTIASFWFLATAQYTRQSFFDQRWKQWLLWIVPVMTLALVWTNEWHGWMWPQVVRSASGNATYLRGVGFWMIAIYTYMIVLCGCVVLLYNAYRTHRFYWRQVWIIILSALLPWIANLTYMLRCNPWTDLDLTPMAFTASGILLTLGVVRFRLLNLLPIARDSVFAFLEEGIIVLDRQFQILDFNPSAQRMVNGVLQVGDGMLSCMPEWKADWFSHLNEIHEFMRQDVATGTAIYWEITISHITASSNEVEGYIVGVRNISVRKTLELERVKLLHNLQEAASQIKSLSGLLPICASCKKIRDDQGYWQSVETYIMDHSDATFSHGFCPECIKNKFPELVPKKPE